MMYTDHKTATVVGLMFATGPLTVLIAIVGWFGIKRLAQARRDQMMM